MTQDPTATATAAAVDDELKRLLSYLKADPRNASLRADAAGRALDSGDARLAREILGEDPAALDDQGLNLLGVAQMQSGEFARAAQSFRGLQQRGVSDPAVAFNLAWSLAVAKDPEAALQQLTPDVTQSLPAAAMLQVRLLHEQRGADEAAEAGRLHLERFPDDEALAATMAVVALDIEDLELARACASKGGEHPDALASLGTLALGEQEPSEAIGLFDRAIAANEKVPRAWVGRGLARLLVKDPKAGADIDRGAEMFDDHIGSWIAAGWAYVINGDLPAARARFERALSIDDSFGESHGSLAVLDILEGDSASAERRAAVALRLDPQSFSGRFAKTLIAERGGDPEAARKLLARILETPVNERGDTAAGALARLGLG